MKHTLVAVLILVVCSAGLVASAAAQGAPKRRPPVIDMHLHALPAKGWPGGPSFICPGMDFAAYDPRTKWDPNHLWESCPNPLFPPATDEELLREMLGTMDRYNVVLAATSGSLEHVRRYRQAAPKRILPALNTAVADLGTPDSLRELIRKGDIAILGEIAPQVEGISPDDEVLEPYYALAEELDIPLAIHVLNAPPHYLVPRNRSFYPQLYVDVAAIDWMLPRKEFYRYLRALVEAGFGKRIMFGSDASMWPQTLAIGIEAIESAGFLSEAQKRDILYNNAARFLRLNEKNQPQKTQKTSLEPRNP